MKWSPVCIWTILSKARLDAHSLRIAAAVQNVAFGGKIKQQFKTLRRLFFASEFFLFSLILEIA